MAAARDDTGAQLQDLSSAEMALAEANAQVYLAQVKAGLPRAAIRMAASPRPRGHPRGFFWRS